MSKLSKNIIYNLFGQFLLLILGFFSVKYVFRHLGSEALGIIYFVGTINIVFVGILDKGIFTTVVREVSSCYKKEPEYVNKFIQTFSLLCWIIFILFGIIIYIAAPFLVKNWLNLSTIEPSSAIAVVRILGIASLTIFPRGFYSSLINGLERMEFSNIITVLTTLLQQLGTIVIIIKFRGNLYHVAVWFAFCYSLSLLSFIIISGYFFSIKSIVFYYSGTVIKRNLDFIKKMIQVSILGLVNKQSDKLIASKLLSAGMFGYYGFVFNYVSKTNMLTTAIAKAAFPSISRLIGTGNNKELMVQYRKLQDLICFFTIPVYMIGIYSSLALLTFLFNKEIANLLFWPIVLLCLGFYMNGTLNIPYKFAIAKDKAEIIIRTSIYSLIIILPISFFLIHFFKLNGIALVWVSYNLFMSLYMLPRIYKECIFIPVRNWYLRLIKSFVLTIVTYGTGWIFLMFTDPYSVFWVLTVFILSTAVFLCITFFVIDKELQQVFLRYFKMFVSSLKLKKADPSIDTAG
ncbi:lipopolysaccharide biosynthesis protein [bacterium]